MTAPSPVIRTESLAVHLPTRNGMLHAVDGVDLDLFESETLAVVGESGCGKSTLGKTLVGLLRPTHGRVLLNGIDVSHFGRAAWRPYRAWAQMVFQDPHSSLNPRKTIRATLEDALRFANVRKSDRPDRLRALLASVGLHADALDRYPHEFSGGQRQRIGIARALAVGPKVIVCDEPVSALDVSIQGQIINLLAELQRRNGVSYLFISHDLSVVQHIADRIAVMYLGRVVELADRKVFWSSPRHPYTRALFDAVPIPDRSAANAARTVLAGEVPNPLAPPSGCPFRTRCPEAFDRCATEQPALRDTGRGHWAACHLA
jgi:oligopeptide/dipeptide ABC transporter ATP-binding protein